MSSTRMDDVVVRLEKVADKLESLSKGVKTSSEEDSRVSEAMDVIINDSVAKLVSLSKSISPILEEASLNVEAGFKQTKTIAHVASISKKPSDSDFQQLLKPLTETLENQKKIEDKHRNSEFKSHLTALSEASVCFGWVSCPGKPQNYIGDMMGTADVYLNRVLKDFKDKPNHKEWVAGLKKCFNDLKEFAQEHFQLGLTWNPNGKEYSAGMATTTNGSTPQPKKEATKPASTQGGAPNTAALFSALNSGTAITKGLKKVDDSLKTHKNPNLRVSSKVEEKEKKEPVKTTTAKKINKEPKEVIEGNNYIYENVCDKQIKIETDTNKYSANFFDCKNLQILVSSKINIISFSGCQKIAIELAEGLIGSVEAINSKSIEIYVKKSVPFISVNGSNSIQIQLTDESRSTSVCTSSSSSVNVAIAKGDDLIEHAVPEVYISTLTADNKLITEIKKDI